MKRWTPLLGKCLHLQHWKRKLEWKLLILQKRLDLSETPPATAAAAGYDQLGGELAGC